MEKTRAVLIDLFNNFIKSFFTLDGFDEMISNALPYLFMLLLMFFVAFLTVKLRRLIKLLDDKSPKD